ncbi:MAG: hypothetical protein OK422_00615 [Thaumarchaeota archaeon]|nr:hypothetical protein [Nitrososphaerota archaeon]
MRTPLFFAGLMTTALGALFFLLGALLPTSGGAVPFLWSVPFVAGGLLMAGIAPFLKESEGPVEAPAGFGFCAFCSSYVKLDAERCDHCGGLQPWARQKVAR